MDTTELLKKVRKIEIKTRGLSSQLFSGEYHSAFKGRGMTFNEVREYQAGDDVRTIDWNVTARFNHPYVKVFNEERELTVMLLVDVSGSLQFGTQTQFKKELMTEICAVLAFSAIQNNDKIGVIFFSDKIEKFIAPKKGKSHGLRIIRELVDFKPERNQTNLAEGLKYLTNIIKKRSIAFVLSDFMDEHFGDALKIASKKHDVVAIRVYDKRELTLPNVGIVKFKDPETGDMRWIDTGNLQVRNSYQTEAQRALKNMQDQFRKSGVDMTSVATDENYVKPLMSLFKKRERKA